MKIAISGANGFIGSHLYKELSKEHEVIKIDRSNILETEADVLYHCAGLSRSSGHTKEEYVEANIDFTKRLVQSVKSECLVFLSTALTDASDYAISKSGGEMVVKSYHNNYKILRLGPIVGPNMTHGALVDFLKKFKEPVLNVRGTYPGSNRPFLHIEDLLFYLKKAPFLRESDYNIGGEHTISLNHLLFLCKKELGLNPKIVFDNTPSTLLTVDSTKIFNEIGYPKYSTIDALIKAINENSYIV